MEIVELAEPTALQNSNIRKRATQTKGERTRQFVALINGKEAGYFAFDDFSARKIGVLYDLLVLPPYRYRGFGSALVEAGYNLCRSLGYQTYRVAPVAFDGSIDEQWLKSWYQRKGFKPSPDGTGEYEMPLN